MAVALKGLTLEQFLRLPEQKPALEYFNGVVTQKMPPMGEHSALRYEVAEFFNLRLRASHIARAFPELRATFEGISVVPDVSVYRWDRIARTPSGHVATRFETALDLVVEIWSAGESIRQATERCTWYVQHGMQVALFVHHRNEYIQVFRADGTDRISRSGDLINLDEISPGVELSVAEIFTALNAD